MVNFYYTFDLFLLLLIIFTTYESFKNKIYIKIFDYFKIFVLITLSAKFAHYTGVTLQKLSITEADTYTTLILIAFSINIVVFGYLGKILFKYSNKYINSHKTKDTLAKIIIFIEVLILITFSLYIVMQINLTKIYLQPILKQSYSYSKIQKFYIIFLNDGFVNIVMGSDTGTNHKEVIFKSLKNSL